MLSMVEMCYRYCTSTVYCAVECIRSTEICVKTNEKNIFFIVVFITSDMLTSQLV